MSEIIEHIMSYAQGRTYFTTSELEASFPDTLPHSQSTIDWYLSYLTKDGALSRVGKGCYSALPHTKFIPEQSETDESLNRKLQEWYPEATFCIYKGAIFSPLQHHLSYNALTYIETQRELTEIIFHRFQDEGIRVFHRPNKAVFYNYIDISKPGIVVKPLISGSPLQCINGITTPMLEKLLVDIRCDDDFDYMGGEEAFRMLKNATSLYSINTTKLLRYAGRRHRRKEFENDFIEIGL